MREYRRVANYLEDARVQTGDTSMKAGLNSHSWCIYI